MTNSDPYDLARFVTAQAVAYATALAELRDGIKRSHWMWFIFPQFDGLGTSSTARHYAIRSVDEARAYLDHPLLGPRYLECVAALQDLLTRDPEAVFGTVDAVKFRSSLTLFEAVRPSPLLGAALERWFGGERDPRTLELLRGGLHR